MNRLRWTFLAMALFFTSVTYAEVIDEFQRITQPPEDWKYNSRSKNYAISDNGRSAAYIVTSDWEQYVVWDGKEGPRFEKVEDLEFTENANHITYKGWRSRASHRVFDDRVEPEWNKNYAQDVQCEHILYRIDNPKKVSRYYHDGELIRELPVGVAQRTRWPLYSSYGPNFFFGGKNPYINNVRIEYPPELSRIMEASASGIKLSDYVVWDADNHSFAYCLDERTPAIVRGVASEVLYVVVHELSDLGSPVKILKYEGRSARFRVAPGTTDAIVAVAPNDIKGCKVYRNDEFLWECEGYCKGIWLSPDGNRIAVLAEFNSNSYNVFVDGQGFEWCPRYKGLRVQFSSNSQHYGFMTRKKDSSGRKRGVIVVDGQISPPTVLQGASGPVFCADGSHWLMSGYPKRGEPAYLIVDGERQEPTGSIWPRSIRFIPGTDETCYVSRVKSPEPGYCLVKSGKAGQVWKKMGPAFISPDGEHFAYWVLADGGWTVAIDDQIGQTRFSQISEPKRIQDWREAEYPGIHFISNTSIRSDLIVTEKKRFVGHGYLTAVLTE